MLIPVDCPYCGERFTTIVEPGDGSQDYIEDCQVCCQPIEIHVEVGFDGEILCVTTHRDND